MTFVLYNRSAARPFPAYKIHSTANCLSFFKSVYIHVVFVQFVVVKSFLLLFQSFCLQFFSCCRFLPCCFFSFLAEDFICVLVLLYILFLVLFYSFLAIVLLFSCCFFIPFTVFLFFSCCGFYVYMQILANNVDFQRMNKDDLILKERMNLYPPRFVFKISATSTAEDSKAVFTFEGATEEIVKEVILTKGITHIICRLLGGCINIEESLSKQFGMPINFHYLQQSLLTLI